MWLKVKWASRKEGGSEHASLCQPLDSSQPQGLFLGPGRRGCGGPPKLRARHHCICVCGGVVVAGGGDCRAGVMTDLFPGSLLQPHVTSMPEASWHG